MASTVWKGHLTFGLVSLPVRLYSAARSESISFNQLHKHDGSRVKQVLYCQLEDKPIPRSEIVKGFEYEKDRYVVIEDEEVKKVAPQTAKVMEILEFVKSDQVDPIYLENLLKMIESKKGGEEIVATPEPQQGKVVDILEALKASLAMAKKPAASERETAKVEEIKPAKKRARG